MQWQGSDDPDGVGIWGYQIYRDGIFVANISRPAFSDTAVSPATDFLYTIYAIDNHGNASAPSSFTIHTPSPGGIDPRRTGVRANGAYYGGMGEQIDMLSGNLNFTLPLLRAQGRGG